VAWQSITRTSRCASSPEQMPPPTAGQRIIFALSSLFERTTGLLESSRAYGGLGGWLHGRLTAVSKSETELAVDVQFASRAASRQFGVGEEWTKIACERVACGA